MKIAFCFLTLGDVFQTKLWERFFAKASSEKFRIYCHPKEPQLVTSNFLCDRIIDSRVPTQHGNISLVKATINLFSTAFYDDPDIQYFVLLSESTIPILPFDQIYQILDRQGSRSIINFEVPPPNSEHHQRLFAMTDPALFSAAFFKHDQWIVLHRRHVSQLLDHPFLSHFDHVFAPDEHYFMNVLVHLRGASLDQFVKHAATFVNWRDKTVKTYTNSETGKFVGRTVHPKTYYQLSANDIVEARSAHCWFFRKVDSACDCTFLLECL
jgi:hypothetical protein